MSTKIGTCAFCGIRVACDERGRLARHGWQAQTAHCSYGQLGAWHTGACPGAVAVEVDNVDLGRLVRGLADAVAEAHTAPVPGPLTRQAVARLQSARESLPVRLALATERLVGWQAKPLADREETRKAVAREKAEAREAKAQAKAEREAAKAAKQAAAEKSRQERLDVMVACAKGHAKGEVVTWRALKKACRDAGLKAPSENMLYDAWDAIGIAANGGTQMGCAEFMIAAYAPEVEAELAKFERGSIERFEIARRHKAVGFRMV